MKTLLYRPEVFVAFDIVSLYGAVTTNDNHGAVYVSQLPDSNGIRAIRRLVK